MKKNDCRNVLSKVAVIYARFSSSNQREESIDAQVRACKEFAERNGYAVKEIYADSAKSATTADRPEFQRMLADSREGAFQFVIVHKLDRFSRDKYDSVTTKRKLKTNGVTLLSVLENIDGSPESVMMESMLEGMAQYYSMNLAREVMKGMKESALQGLHLGGKPPLGYEVDPVTRMYVVNLVEAQIVREIFAEYTSGNMGCCKLLAYLNGRGYRTKRGNSFGANSLSSILRNEKYAGVYTFNLRKEKGPNGKRNPSFNPVEDVIRIEGAIPAIIDRETFDKAQAKLDKRNSNGGRNKAKEYYVLSGMIYCGECGSCMQGNTRFCGRGKSKYSSYRCASRKQHKGCCNKEIRKEYLEDYVIRTLYDNLFSEHSSEALARMLTDYVNRKNITAEEELKTIQSDLREVERKIAAIIEMVTTSGISADTVAASLRELEEEKLALQEHAQRVQVGKSKVDVTGAQVLELVERSRQFIQSKNIPECRVFLGTCIDRVVVYHDRVEVLFKLHLPDAETDELKALVTEETIKDIRADYRAG